MNDADLIQLQRLAKKATRGDWIAVGWTVENASDRLPDICSTSGRAAFHDTDAQQCIDASYIAAANPKVVLALLNLVMTQKAQIIMLHKTLDAHARETSK